MADITYTTSSSGVFTEDLVLHLYAGSPVDDTAWLDGGAAANSYPGSLSGFQAKNSNTTNATQGFKLVCGRLTTAVATGETLTVSGGATTVHGVIVGDNTTAAAGVTASFSGGVVTFTVTGTSATGVTLWMIVA